MSGPQWAPIASLAVRADLIRYVGSLTGDATDRHPALRALLRDLPGCLVMALVASSLAGKEPLVWLAGAASLATAVRTNHVIATTVAGTLAHALLRMR